MAIKSFGTTISIGDGNLASTPTYTAVADVREITPPAKTTIMANATHLSSSGGAYEQVPSGMFEEREWGFVILLNPDGATHTSSAAGGIQHAQDNGNELAWKVTTNATTLNETVFDGYVKVFEPVYGDGTEVIMANVTIGQTGQATIS